MTIPILMPALSPTREEGKLAKWLVGEGDEVRAGDVIAEIETDKATMEVEAADDGQVGKILVPAGTEGVKANTPIALLLQDGEDVAKPAPEAEPVEMSQMAKIAEMIKMAPFQSPSEVGALEDPDLGEMAPEIEEAPAGPRQAPLEPGPVAEIPPGTEMVAMTVREALRDAMAEEMRAQDTIF